MQPMLMVGDMRDKTRKVYKSQSMDSAQIALKEHGERRETSVVHTSMAFWQCQSPIFYLPVAVH